MTTGLELPLDRTEFLTGLVAGSVAFTAAGIAAAILRLRSGAGLAFAAAALVGLDLIGDLPGGLVIGVALAAAGAAITNRGHLAVRMSASAPGAWVVAAQSGVRGDSWVRALIFTAIVAGGALVADLDVRTARRGLAPLLFAISVAGVYSTVPDTEQVLVLAGVVAPIAALGWPLCRATLGPAGSTAAVAVLVWTAAAGGVGRPSSIVGAVACLGLFVLAPLAPPPARLNSLVIIGAHALLVGVGARVVGLRSTVPEAVAVAVVELAVAVAVCGIARSRP